MNENNLEGEQRERCKVVKFVDENSAALIQRVTSVLPIADELRSKGMLHGEKYDEIKEEKTRQDKMRKLFESLNTDKIKIAFYNLLEKFEPHLFEELGGVRRKRKLSDPESPVPCKRPNTEFNEQNNPNFNIASTSAPINFVTNIVNERRPYENIHNISLLPFNKMEWKTPAPKKEKKTPEPKKVKKTPAPKKEKKTPEPKKVKKTPAPKKEKTPAPMKEKKTPAPKKEKKTPAPKKEKTPAPKKEKTPAPKKEKTPAPKKEKTPAPKKEKTPAPKKEKIPAPKKVKTPAPKKVKKTPAPKKEKTPAPKKVKTPAPKKVKKTPAPKKVKKAAARK